MDFRYSHRRGYYAERHELENYLASHKEAAHERMRQIANRLALGHSCQEIADWYGISRERVYQLRRKIARTDFAIDDGPIGRAA